MFTAHSDKVFIRNWHVCKEMNMYWLRFACLPTCLVSNYGRKEGRKCFYLMTHSTHFIYGQMASDIWLRTILIVKKETRCRHIGYSFRLPTRVLLYAPSHRQDSTYHGLCHGALAGTRNSPMGPPWRVDPTTHRTMSERSCHGATSHSSNYGAACLTSLYKLHFSYFLCSSELDI